MLWSPKILKKTLNTNSAVGNKQSADDVKL